MMRRRFRLKSKTDFNRVYRHGRAAKSDHLMIRASLNQLTHNRAAVVVSTRVSKKAVVRNRIRRRLWGQLKAIWPDLKTGHDLIITVSSDVAATPASELTRQLNSCLKATRILN